MIDATDLSHGDNGPILARQYELGRAAGKRECSETHGDINTAWWKIGHATGCRDGYQDGRTQGALTALLVLAGLGLVARVLAQWRQS